MKSKRKKIAMEASARFHHMVTRFFSERGQLAPAIRCARASILIRYGQQIMGEHNDCLAAFQLGGIGVEIVMLLHMRQEDQCSPLTILS